MPKKGTQLSDFAANVYSQHGEDGIIATLLGWLGIKDGLCVEFGAWDGYKFSNTAHLWKNGWSAVLIEADPIKFARLESNIESFPKVKALRRMVGLEPGSRWYDDVMVPDLVSIDIDGNDYWIFQDSPRGPALYIVEYNTTIPAWLDIYTPYAPDNAFGCSLGALARVATEKGYDYIGSTRSNGFFLRHDLRFRIPEFPRDLRHAANEDDLVYLMTSFTGEFKETKVGPYGRTHYYPKPVIQQPLIP